MIKSIIAMIIGLASLCAFAAVVYSDEPQPHRPVDPIKAKLGYVFLRKLPLGNLPFGRELFKRSDFDKLYLAWPWEGSAADNAWSANAEQRRKLAYARYGFVDAPYDNDGLPMGLVYNPKTEGVHLNCLFCHGGTIHGMTIAGLPNQRLDMATFYEDVKILSYLKAGKCPPSPSRSIEGSSKISRTRGGSNVWIVEARLLDSRDDDLNPLPAALPDFLGGPDDQAGQPNASPAGVSWSNFDTTPSPFWSIRKKTHLYHAGFVSFNARPPMLAVLYNTDWKADRITKLLPDFENVSNWLDSIRPPKYPGHINYKRARAGKLVFEKACAGCHGTYGENGEYRNHDVDIAKIGTDPVDLEGKGDLIQKYYTNWFNKDKTGATIDTQKSLERQSYLAPPLDGIWASAPYLHNGSVPTLYHILHPDQRPSVWRVVDYERYDHQLMGLLFERSDTVPKEITVPEKRRYFDTSVPGLSNAGHLFANELTEEEKGALLEYLKTL